jgi:hypothetical protein
VEDDLVARVDYGGHGRGDRLGRADGDDDLVIRVVADVVQPLQVSGEGPTQLQRPVVAGVVGSAAAQRTHALLDDLWRSGEVRFTDAQTDDVRHGRDHVEELANARRRHGTHALRQALASCCCCWRGFGDHVSSLRAEYRSAADTLNRLPGICLASAWH